MPDTITGLSKPPAKPSNVYLVRWSFGGVRREDIPCHTIYAGARRRNSLVDSPHRHRRVDPADRHHHRRPPGKHRTLWHPHRERGMRSSAVLAITTSLVLVATAAAAANFAALSWIYDQLEHIERRL